MTVTATSTRPRRAARLSEYSQRLADIPEDRFFGSILWYTIAGTRAIGTGADRRVVPVRVAYDTLCEWLTDLGIDDKHVPPAIKKIDAFKNACGQAKRTYQLPDQEAQYCELRVEHIKTAPDVVTRHIVKVVRDEHKEQVSMEHVGTLKFIRGGRTAKGKRHSGDHVRDAILTRVRGQEREEVQALIDDFWNRYDDLSGHLHANALRGVVRSILTEYNAISMKPSAGLYFIHRSYWDRMMALVQLLGRMGDGCQIEEVPLVDTEERRATVKAALETEVETDCNRLLADIAALNAAGGKVKPTDYAEINAQYHEIAARVEEYADMLKLSQGRAADALELALGGVLGVAGRIGS